MPGKTISAYTDEQTARLVGDLARTEKRTPSQIAAEAIAFYVRLPREAHSSLRELEGEGDPAHLALLVRRVTRAIIRAGYDASLERVASEAREIHGDTIESEDAILAEAVRLTSSTGGGRRASLPATGVEDAEGAAPRRRAS